MCRSNNGKIWHGDFDGVYASRGTYLIDCGNDGGVFVLCVLSFLRTCHNYVFIAETDVGPSLFFSCFFFFAVFCVQNCIYVSSKESVSCIAETACRALLCSTDRADVA